MMETSVEGKEKCTLCERTDNLLKNENSQICVSSACRVFNRKSKPKSELEWVNLCAHCAGHITYLDIFHDSHIRNTLTKKCCFICGTKVRNTLLEFAEITSNITKIVDVFQEAFYKVYDDKECICFNCVVGLEEWNHWIQHFTQKQLLGEILPIKHQKKVSFSPTKEYIESGRKSPVQFSPSTSESGEELSPRLRKRKMRKPIKQQLYHLRTLTSQLKARGNKVKITTDDTKLLEYIAYISIKSEEQIPENISLNIGGKFKKESAKKLNFERNSAKGVAKKKNVLKISNSLFKMRTKDKIRNKQEDSKAVEPDDDNTPEPYVLISSNDEVKDALNKYPNKSEVESESMETSEAQENESDTGSEISEEILLDGNKFICKLCSKELKDSDELEQHIRVQHYYVLRTCLVRESFPPSRVPRRSVSPKTLNSILLKYLGPESVILEKEQVGEDQENSHPDKTQDTPVESEKDEQNGLETSPVRDEMEKEREDNENSVDEDQNKHKEDERDTTEAQKSDEDAESEKDTETHRSDKEAGNEVDKPDIEKEKQDEFFKENDLSVTEECNEENSNEVNSTNREQTEENAAVLNDNTEESMASEDHNSEASKIAELETIENAVADLFKENSKNLEELSSVNGVHCGGENGDEDTTEEQDQSAECLGFETLSDPVDLIDDKANDKSINLKSVDEVLQQNDILDLQLELENEYSSESRKRKLSTCSDEDAPALHAEKKAKIALDESQNI